MTAADLYMFIKDARDKLFTLAVSTGFSSFGKRGRICLPLRIYGERHISVGNDVYIGANSWLQARASQADACEKLIEIGDHVSIAGHCTISAIQQVLIQDNVLIARYVYISDHSHATDDLSKPIKDQSETPPAPVKICSGAWLGQSVVICPGTTVGKNSVVGANSVVTTSIPDYSVAVGAPARVVKYLTARANA